MENGKLCSWLLALRSLRFLVFIIFTIWNLHNQFLYQESAVIWAVWSFSGKCQRIEFPQANKRGTSYIYSWIKLCPNLGKNSLLFLVDFRKLWGRLMKYLDQTIRTFMLYLKDSSLGMFIDQKKTLKCYIYIPINSVKICSLHLFFCGLIVVKHHYWTSAICTIHVNRFPSVPMF